MSKLNIIQAPCKNFRLYGTPRSGKLDSIQLHTIGCAQNTGMNIVNNMNQSSPSGITHYVIDAEKEMTVYQLLPDTNTCWADAGKGNRCAISFEIAESDSMKYTGGASFTITNKEKFMADMKRGYEAAVVFVAQKCKEYGWDPQEKLSDGRYRVWSHKEGNALGLSSNHGDPDHYWSKGGYTMDKFRADVKAEMQKDLRFKVGQKYKLLGSLYIRESAGGTIKKYADVSESCQEKSSNVAGKCKLKKGTVVKCLEVKERKGNIWIRVSNGWIAGYYNKKDKIEEYPKESKVKVKTSGKVKIRKTASATGKFVSYIDAGTYGITAEKNGYGKLKSGAGWIKLTSKYVEKV